MDTAPARLLVAIPVYNHGRTLRDVAQRALAVHPDVLVVDDGSTDGGSRDPGRGCRCGCCGTSATSARGRRS